MQCKNSIGEFRKIDSKAASRLQASCLCYGFGSPSKAASFARTALRTSAGALSKYRTRRCCQSMLLTASDRIVPAIFKPGGRSTSNGYPLIELVTGTTIANPLLLLYPFGESTTAGRQPACLGPACSASERPALKSTLIKSPVCGTYSAATIPHYQPADPSLAHDGGSAV